MSFVSSVTSSPAFGNVMNIIGTATKVFGQISGSQQQAGVHDYNAAVSRQRADLTRQAGQLRVDRLRREKASFANKQIAAYAGAGVTMVGSPLQVIADTAAELEMDILIEDFNTRIGILNAETDAELDYLRSDIASRTGFMNAGTTLLSQIPNFVSSQNKAKVTTTSRPTTTTISSSPSYGTIASSGGAPMSGYF